MKRIITLLIAGTIAASAFADNEIASTVVKTSDVTAVAAHQGGRSHVYLDFNNQGSNGHIVIAATTPVATQAQLHTSVKVSGKPIEVMVHALPLEEGGSLKLTHHGENIALLGLKQRLVAGETIPVTVIYRDGSYQTLKAKIR